MATLPADGPSESHRAREIAESFGADAAHYDRARPDYPQQLAVQVLAAAPGRDVLDVGIGTGLSARGFRAAGARVTGLDVDDRMAAFARGQGYAVEIARFEDWDPSGRSFDAVVAGQTWHWVDPAAGTAQAARVLRPVGRLAVFWNAFGIPGELADAFAAVHQRVLTGLPFGGPIFLGPDAYAGLVDRAADAIRADGHFGEPERWRLDRQRAYTRDQWLDLVPTAGGINRLAPDVLAELLAGVGAAIDDAGGSFTMTYSTLVCTAARV